MVWYVTKRYGMVYYGIVCYSMVRYGTVGSRWFSITSQCCFRIMIFSVSPVLFGLLLLKTFRNHKCTATILVKFVAAVQFSEVRCSVGDVNPPADINNPTLT